jgi:hypothetical protein
MGYSKVVVVNDRTVKFVHQLDQNGESYAEDVTVELQDGVPASRLEYFVAQDGKVGVASFGFSPLTGIGGPIDLRFPE